MALGQIFLAPKPYGANWIRTLLRAALLDPVGKNAVLAEAVGKHDSVIVNDNVVNTERPGIGRRESCRSRQTRARRCPRRRVAVNSRASPFTVDRVDVVLVGEERPPLGSTKRNFSSTTPPPPDRRRAGCCGGNWRSGSDWCADRTRSDECARSGNASRSARALDVSQPVDGLVADDLGRQNERMEPGRGAEKKHVFVASDAETYAPAADNAMHRVPAGRVLELLVTSSGNGTRSGFDRRGPWRRDSSVRNRSY